MSDAQSLEQELLAALAWQVELGADEAILDAPVDRFAEAAPPVPADAAAIPAAPRGQEAAPGAEADARPRETRRPAEARAGTPAETDAPSTAALARAASSLEELAEAMRDFEGSDLKAGARNFVFCDGQPGARVMVIGEAPGSEEDRVGRPFVGRAGQLLDRMLGAIGLARTAPDPADAAYIVNILPWRPPGNRAPTTAEAQLFLPFVLRHIELAGPDFVLALGNTPMKALLATEAGITRMRGRWRRQEATGRPLMPSFHPAYLLRSPEKKREAWRDLLALRAALDGARVSFD